MTIAWRAVRQVRASEEVAAQIVQAFYDERLKPGEWLGTEAELATRFNVSRVTIRDAVGALDGDVDAVFGALAGVVLVGVLEKVIQPGSLPVDTQEKLGGVGCLWNRR